MKRRDEFALIRWLNDFRQLKAEGLKTGIGDDAAVFSVDSDFDMLAACDTMVETVHFRTEFMSAYEIGYKALASNLSDIAAMGGIPQWALISLAVSEAWSDEQLKELYRGIYELAARYEVGIIGGDTVKTPDALSISVTVLGKVEKDRALLRSGAREGDAVFVTGSLGHSAAGLHWLYAHCKSYADAKACPPDIAPLVRAYQQPEPDVQAGRLLQDARVHALNDISDGLAGEAWEIAEASGAQLLLQREAIPVSRELEAYAADCGRDPLQWVLFGGEDYRLLGTAGEEKIEPLTRIFEREGIPFHLIGEVRAGKPGVWLQSDQGLRLLKRDGYRHF